MSLVEVLIAGLVLAAALLPAIDLFTGSQVEVVKSRGRLIASGIIAAVGEDMRARPAASRAGFGPVAVDTLPAVAALLTAYAGHHASPAGAARADLAGFRASGLLGDGFVAVTVTWQESGVARTLTRSVPLGVEP